MLQRKENQLELTGIMEGFFKLTHFYRMRF